LNTPPSTKAQDWIIRWLNCNTQPLLPHHHLSHSSHTTTPPIMLAALFASHLKPRVVQRLVGQTCATLRWASYSTTHDRWSNGSKSLSDVDNEVAELISDEAARQRLGLELIASEVQALQALHYKHYNYKHYNYKHYTTSTTTTSTTTTSITTTSTTTTSTTTTSTTTTSITLQALHYKHYNYKHYTTSTTTTSTTLASCANGHYNS
jgi:hypothetical protein